MSEERVMASSGLGRRDVAVAAVIALLVVAALLGMVAAYRFYRDTLLDAQSRTLTVMAVSASETLEGYFDLRFRELDLAFGDDAVERASSPGEDPRAAVGELLETFETCAAATGLEFVDIATRRQDADVVPGGAFAAAGSWEQLVDVVGSADGARLGTWRKGASDVGDDDQGYLMTLWRPVRAGGDLLGCVVETIDLNVVYDEVLGPIQVGKRGYCTVKDPGRTIVMHRVHGQIGSNTQVDRVEGHPEGDWGSLAAVQYSGEPGCEVVTSYWWDDVDAGLAKKFIGYAPAMLDGNLFVVNVVMAYDELMEPLQTMWYLCIGLGALVLALVSVGGWKLAKSVQSARGLQRELAYEQELLAQTQRVKLQERQIQHMDRVQTAGIVTSSVAHELKNHMTPLVIYGQMLQAPDLLEEDRVEAAAEVEKLAQRCAEMLERMLAYVRRKSPAGAGVQEGGDAPGVFDATAAVREALAMVRPMCPRDVSLAEQVCDDACMVVGDPGSVGQILLNLATNALYAMREGGGELGVAWGPDPEKAGMWRLSVSDTGCGMDDDVRRQLFSTFFTTKGDEGTGLGMSVVQSLVQEMHGSIEVESELGVGSEFVVRLPRA